MDGEAIFRIILVMTLCHISLITSDFEHLFMCLLAILSLFIEVSSQIFCSYLSYCVHLYHSGFKSCQHKYCNFFFQYVLLFRVFCFSHTTQYMGF